ncbi:MAG TPA: hypothetical protein DC047_15895 [Blastocatellia bacterium]|nr:hypothetical protein [Blastocatellia bacterium]
MITGFNTDVEHDGVVYHVQTEDKGLDSPLILSLVYSGGAILASKRSRYEDLIEAGFDEATLAQRLKRQHRLICAAINAGRLEDLKRMGERTETAEPEVSLPTPPEPAPDDARSVASAPAEEETVSTVSPVDVDLPKVARRESAYTVHDSRRTSPLGEKAEPDSALLVTLTDDQPFRAGQSVTIKILVQKRMGGVAEPVDHAAVAVKILGTAFRPQLYSVTTNRHGVASVGAEIPQFNSGRAAVIIRVDAAGASCETRRVIHPAS